MVLDAVKQKKKHLYSTENDKKIYQTFLHDAGGACLFAAAAVLSLCPVLFYLIWLTSGRPAQSFHKIAGIIIQSLFTHLFWSDLWAENKDVNIFGELASLPAG